MHYPSGEQCWLAVIQVATVPFFFRRPSLSVFQRGKYRSASTNQHSREQRFKKTLMLIRHLKEPCIPYSSFIHTFDVHVTLYNVLSSAAPVTKSPVPNLKTVRSHTWMGHLTVKMPAPFPSLWLWPEIPSYVFLFC